jgi:murein DD-endopeptidase MepM/ murein hydrolase activator NlpD
LPDSRRPLRRITLPRPLRRFVVHLVVIGMVASTAALGISSARTASPSASTTRDGTPTAFSFQFVAPARAAGDDATADDASELRSTTFELVPDPSGGDPILSRRAARYAPSGAPTPLPTPVAPPAPAADPPAPAALSAQPPAMVGTGSLAWPVSGSVSQYFHAGHPALDIAAPYGTAAHAADSGVVNWAGWRNNGGGYVVSIDHGNGMTTVYNHLSSIWVSAGQAVSQGQGVGAVGCTGICTGPHLHFEVVVGGVDVNPLRYL